VVYDQLRPLAQWQSACLLSGNSPLGASAHLQIGRAYAMSGDAAKATRISLWKDADPDIPILKQAKAENAKLQ
jgi:eukaryotic-like serine/threonine-protein kinase